jgi:hypothetical protein
LYGTLTAHDAQGISQQWQVPSFQARPQSFIALFERPKRAEKAAGLVLTACRSITRFSKPLKTRSSSLLIVASSSSNTTRFATSNELAVAAQLAKNVDGRSGGPDAEDLRSRAFENPQKGCALLLFCLRARHTFLKYRFKIILLIPLALSQFIEDLVSLPLNSLKTKS